MHAERERAPGCLRIAEAAAHEGALLQMQDGSMWTYASRDHEGLIACGPGANFPVPCPFMVPTPLAALQHLGECPSALTSCLPLLVQLCHTLPSAGIYSCLSVTLHRIVQAVYFASCSSLLAWSVAV